MNRESHSEDFVLSFIMMLSYLNLDFRLSSLFSDVQDA